MRILYVEPFCGGSHAMFTRVLTTALEAKWTSLTLPGRFWKWRMRGSAVWLARTEAGVLDADYDLFVASSYLPLGELVGLVPKLSHVPKVLYFHENQLAYPMGSGGAVDPRLAAERDLHYGFTQMVSALAAQRCVFNSAYNRDSFLAEAKTVLQKMPDAIPPGWVEAIEARSEVLGVPLELPDRPPQLVSPTPEERRAGPIILWNHRWEHDKGPQRFFDVLQPRGALRPTPRSLRAFRRGA